MNGFENFASYDRPRLVAEMVLDNEATMRGVRNAIFAPEKLSAAEREGFTARLKEAAGGTGIGNALVDIATNPFVWLGFLFHGRYSDRFNRYAKEGRDLFAPRIDLHSTEREGNLFLQAIRGLTATETLEGGPANEALKFVLNKVNQLELEEDDFRTAVSAFKEKNGIKGDMGLDPRLLAGKQKDAATRGLTAFFVRAMGWDNPKAMSVLQGRTRYVQKVGSEITEVTPEAFVTLSKASEDARRAGNDPGYELFQHLHEIKLTPKVHNGVRLATPNVVDPREVDAVLRETGADGLLEGWNKTHQKYLKMVMGRDDSAEFVPDPVKIEKAMRGIVGNDVMALKLSSAGDPKSINIHEGLPLVVKLFDQDMERAIAHGLVGKDQRRELLKSLAHHLGEEQFMPLNVKQRFRPDGTPAPTPTGGGIGIDLLNDASARLIPRTSSEEVFHGADLDMVESVFPNAKIGLMPMRQKYAEILDYQGGDKGKEFTVHRIMPFSAVDRYRKDMQQVYATRVAELDERAMKAYRDYIKSNGRAGQYKHPRSGGQSDMEFENVRQERDPFSSDVDPNTGEVVTSTPNARWTVDPANMDPGVMPGVAQEPGHVLSAADLVNMHYKLMKNPDGQRELADVILPAVLGRGAPERVLSNGNWLFFRKMMRYFVDGPGGKMMEGMGHGDWVGRMRGSLDNDLQLFPGGGLSHGLAKYLYTTHLGFNPGSVVLNLFQPLTLGGTVLGPTAVMKAYGRAMGEFLDYAKDRVGQYGVGRITDSQRLALMEKNFKFMGRASEGRNILGIGPNLLQSIDTAMMSRGGRGSTNWLDQVFERSMKGFEKSEWLNRNVMAHAAEIRLGEAGRKLDPYSLAQIERVVQQTQFPSDVMNQPTGFLSGRLMSNPLVRQFFTFNARSFTSVFNTLPRMLEQNYWPGLASSMARGMGTSAIVYELVKNMTGGDMSRALYGNTAVSVFGGDRLAEGKTPLPPVVDIPLGLMQAFLGDDKEAWGRTLPRIVPGGIALSRALGSAPALPAGALGLQKTFVDWSAKTPEGLVPVFKQDGSLIDYRSGTELIFKSIGADLGAWQQPGELDNHLVKIAEETQSYRNEYMRALQMGNIPKAKAVAAEYQKRNKLPLTVSATQMKQNIALREVPRTERVLNRLPQDQREIYSKVVQRVRGEAALGLPEGALTKYSTAAQRAGVRHQNVPADAKTQALIEAAQLAAAGQQTQPPFAPFSQ